MKKKEKETEKSKDEKTFIVRCMTSGTFYILGEKEMQEHLKEGYFADGDEVYEVKQSFKIKASKTYGLESKEE